LDLGPCVDFRGSLDSWDPPKLERIRVLITQGEDSALTWATNLRFFLIQNAFALVSGSIHTKL